MSKRCLYSENLGKVKDYKFCYPVLFSYKKGGVASGMRHTETNAYDIERLLHVKGKKRVIAKEVSHVSHCSHATHCKSLPTLFAFFFLPLVALVP